MIFVMSKRVYLNVVCQSMTKDVLLNANYYIADRTTPDRVREAVHGTFKCINGQWYNTDDLEESQHIKKATVFNIRYGTGCLNPGPYVTSFLVHDNETEQDFLKRMKETLTTFNNMRQIMEEIYLPARRGNGILFMIFMNDDNIINFGDMICQHLVDYFGEPITFLDPKYRPNIRGKEHYECNNIEFVQRVTKDLRDSIQVADFLAAVSQTQDFSDPSTNVTEFLAGVDSVKDLIHLYELLWPDDPLPRGKYSRASVIEIINAKILDSKSTFAQSKQNRLNVIEVYDPEYY